MVSVVDSFYSLNKSASALGKLCVYENPNVNVTTLDSMVIKYVLNQSHMWTTLEIYSYVFETSLLVLSTILLISFRLFCSYIGVFFITCMDRTEWWRQRRHLCMVWQYCVYIYWLGYMERYTSTGWRHSGKLRWQLFWRLVRRTVFFEHTLYMWNVKQSIRTRQGNVTKWR